MISVTDLPTLNASLNATCALLLASGYIAIKKKRVAVHRACMLSAIGVSAIFLTSYLYYHYHVGTTPFTGAGWIRPVYFTILISHTILAASIVPLVIVTVYRALKQNFARHRRIARWTWPIWMYVSLTGVVVYLMLYQLYPS